MGRVEMGTADCAKTNFKLHYFIELSLLLKLEM